MARGIQVRTVDDEDRALDHHVERLGHRSIAELVRAALAAYTGDAIFTQPRKPGPAKGSPSPNPRGRAGRLT